MNQELGQHRIDVVLDAGRGERRLDHDSGAASDRSASHLEPDRRVAAAAEHIIQRIGEVRRGIDKRAVEIEDDGRAFERARLFTRLLAAWQGRA